MKGRRYHDAKSYHHLYNTTEWRKRRKAQLDLQPLCEMCLEMGRTTAANIADHVEPHHGDEFKFWHGKLASLCKPCHDGPKKSLEVTGKRRGCDVNGIPFDSLKRGG